MQHSSTLDDNTMRKETSSAVRSSGIIPTRVAISLSVVKTNGGNNAKS